VTECTNKKLFQKTTGYLPALAARLENPSAPKPVDAALDPNMLLLLLVVEGWASDPKRFDAEPDSKMLLPGVLVLVESLDSKILDAEPGLAPEPPKILLAAGLEEESASLLLPNSVVPVFGVLHY
jgi:hypothetical protein